MADQGTVARQKRVQWWLSLTLLIALGSLVLGVVTTTFGLFGYLQLGPLQVSLSVLTTMASLAAAALVYRSATALGDAPRVAALRAALAVTPFLGLMVAAGELGRLGNARLKRGDENNMLGMPSP